MAQPHSVLVVDDDPALRRTLELRLREEGYAVRVADSGERALALLAAAPADLVITDARMDRMDGLAPFSELQRSHPRLPVMILTAHGSIPDAGDTTRRGAFAYLTRPIDAAQLLGEVRRAIRLAAPAATPAASWRAQIVTRNPRLMATLDEAQAVAATDASVLICGETGTGKELLAQAIHDASARGARPFVAVNCGPIPEHLMESELFGHLRGAFTGALRDQRGLVASADGGTLFLDEIGDMPLEMQVSLLRVLQSREVTRVGGSYAIAVDVRVIAATNRNLALEVQEGNFRSDLLYRLDVLNICIPPFRERREDIPVLIEAVLSRWVARGRSIRFTAAAMEALRNYNWPGNARELENLMEKCVILSGRDEIDLADLSEAGFGQASALRLEAVQARPAAAASLRHRRQAPLSDVVRQAYEAAWATCQGDVIAVARTLGISRATAYRRANAYGLLRHPPVS